MSKRALMLTAATAALLSGPVLGDDFTDITTKVTQQIKTSTADNGAPGDILIESTGSVVVATAGPAVEIDSANTVTNQGTISNIGTDNAIGVQLDAKGGDGNGPGADVFALDSAGTIDLTGSGATKTGIFVGLPSGDTTDTAGSFNGGINLENGSTLKATGDNTTALAIGANTTLNGTVDLDGTVTLSGGTGMTGVQIGTATAPAFLNGDLTLGLGSAVGVTGDNSFGINIEPGSTVTGNIEIDGSLSVAPTTATSVTGGSVTGILVSSNSAGNAISGNFTVGTGASVSATGADARGIVLLGGLGGSFTNNGTIEAVGAAAPTSSSGNPTGLNAVAIAGNIGDGFLNNGPVNAVDTTGAALIEGNGSEPVLLISPAAAGATASGNVEISANPLLPEGDFGIVNRGQILANPGNVDQLNAVAVQLEGAGSFTTDVEGGIFNSGKIAASGTGDDKQTALMFATGLYVRSGANVPLFVNSDQNSASPGVVSAQFSGGSNIGGAAVAVHVETGGTLGEIDNQGTIAANATNTETTISSLAARAIWDESGTLSKIVNSGTISATATTLDNNSQVTVAIDMGAATHDTSIDNSGTIAGDVILGDAGDQVLVHGDVNQAASITGNISFGGTSATGSGDDRLEIDNHASVAGNVIEQPGGLLDVLINTGGTLTLTNDSIDIHNRLFVNNLTVGAGGTLVLTLSQPYNISGNPNAGGIVTATGPVMLNPQALLNLSFGGFLSGQTPGEPSQFILIDAPLGQLQLDLPALQNQVCSDVPFLFASSDQQCLTTNPITPDRSQLVLNLTPKTAADIGLTGYAAKMFPLANLALANDSQLGAAIIQAGVPVNGVPLTQAQGQTLYQNIYSQFAPNVTGASRALAIALTDEATGPVGARQRALRMYAGQPGDTTLWGQEFNFSLNEDASANTIGYRDTGFGFALGLDGGDPADGRYGGALTFYSGNIDEKQPRTSRTTSEWALLSGYTDWRGRGFFLDTQVSAGVGQLDGKRALTLDIPQPDGTTTSLSRVAEGRRATLLGALGATTGVILTTGSTVFTPMLSVDGLAMREEGYTEHGGGDPSGGDAFDLAVSPAYYSSLRGFLGADVRQDVNLGDFYLQPEARAGYRYDFLSNPEKLKASFASTPGTNFTLTGPDPSQGNLVLGGSLASTTGAWSIGVNYDYLRGNNGSVSQEGTLTLVGRI